MTNINPGTIYGGAGEGDFYSPFNLDLDPMERLLLIGIESDPDTVYVGFEPQVFDDPVNGTGLMVIAYLKNGKMDIYHQPGLTLEHKDFSIVGKGLEELIERPMEGAYFEVSPTGIDCEIAFEDKAGRPIELRIHERGGKPCKPFPLLAPFGSGTEHPPSLALAFMYDFYFVRRAGTEVVIKVDGQTRKPDSLPVPIDLSRVHFLRYSADPFIVTWNATRDGPLTALQPSGVGEFRDGDTVYDLVENDGHFEIRQMSIGNDKHTIDFTFTPPVPDVAGLKDGATVEGRFTIHCEDSSGHIGGVYNVSRRGDQVDMMIHPSEGWKPRARKWSVKVMFLVISLFKRWPKTYVWNAAIQLGGEDVTMQSAWSRTESPKGFRGET